MTNRQFLASRQFRIACELVNIPPTVRQASKYRRGKGLAVTKKRLARTLYNQEQIRKED